MANVSKTLTWQSTGGDVDHYQIAIAATVDGTKTILVTTNDASTSATITYDEASYPTAWVFVRAVDSSGASGAWSDPISATSLDPAFTPPSSVQYAYANDVLDELIGVTLPNAITTEKLNKKCEFFSREIDRLVGRKFTPQSVVEKYDGTGTNELIVNHYPVTRLNYVQISDGSGLTITRTYSASDLDLSDYEEGILVLKPIIIDNLTDTWQTASALLYGHVFSPGIRNVEVSYEYGHLFYIEGETLVLSSTTSSSGSTTRTYQARHHNWAANNISIYKNGTLMTSGYTVNTAAGVVTIADGDEDDTITAYYYHKIPAPIEAACAKMAAIWALQQQVAGASGGVTSFKNLAYQEVYGTKPHGQLISNLQNEVNAILREYKDIAFSAA